MKNWKVNILTVKLFSVAAKDLVFSGGEERSRQRFMQLPAGGSNSRTEIETGYIIRNRSLIMRILTED